MIGLFALVMLTSPTVPKPGPFVMPGVKVNAAWRLPQDTSESAMLGSDGRLRLHVGTSLLELTPKTNRWRVRFEIGSSDFIVADDAIWTWPAGGDPLRRWASGAKAPQSLRTPFPDQHFLFANSLGPWFAAGYGEGYTYLWSAKAKKPFALKHWPSGAKRSFEPTHARRLGAQTMRLYATQHYDGDESKATSYVGTIDLTTGKALKTPVAIRERMVVMAVVPLPDGSDFVLLDGGRALVSATGVVRFESSDYGELSPATLLANGQVLVAQGGTLSWHRPKDLKAVQDWEAVDYDFRGAWTVGRHTLLWVRVRGREDWLVKVDATAPVKRPERP